LNRGEQGFPAACRIQERRDFKIVERQGGRASGPHFVVFVQSRGKSIHRLGITVSRRVGGAVVRNRVKRLVREVFRRHKGDVPRGDSVVIARTGAGNLSYGGASEELLRLWSRAGLGRP
jgi:ribonuclease P protein component